MLCTCSGQLTLGTTGVVDYGGYRRSVLCTCSSLLTLGTGGVVDFVLGIWAIGVVHLLRPADVGDWWRCCAGDYVRCGLLALLPLGRPDMTVMVDWA